VYVFYFKKKEYSWQLDEESDTYEPYSNGISHRDVPEKLFGIREKFGKFSVG